MTRQSKQFKIIWYYSRTFKSGVVKWINCMPLFSLDWGTNQLMLIVTDLRRNLARLRRWQQVLHRKDRNLTAKRNIYDVQCENNSIVTHYHYVLLDKKFLSQVESGSSHPVPIRVCSQQFHPIYWSRNVYSQSADSPAPPKRMAPLECSLPSLEEPPEIEQQDVRHGTRNAVNTYIR